ncbi:MAG: amidohydrolase [Proteocatella sp.]
MKLENDDLHIEKIKEEFKKIEEKISLEVEDVCGFIFRNPELSEEEYVCSAFLIDFMENNGFTVEPNYCDYETAFRAEFVLGSGDGPSIAFLAEYDALPVVFSENEKRGKRDKKIIRPGHTCGHNWIAAATVGVSVGLSKLEGLNGRVILIGTPAEETVGSKVDMVSAGAFDDIDIVIQPHLESYTDISCTALALDALEFRFHGKATHAASYPYKGINALDGVQLMFSGVNAMRQQLREDAKICGIVTSGGEASNIIPDYASCRYTVRAKNRTYLSEVTQRVINCARGAELMTGALLEYDFFENQTDDILNVDILQEMIKKYMIEEGIENINDSIVNPTGSSDIGNVSQVCPTMYFEMDIEADGEFCTHEKMALDYVNSAYAHKKLHQAIKIMGNMSLELILDKFLVETIKRRHMELRSVNYIK